MRTIAAAALCIALASAALAMDEYAIKVYPCARAPQAVTIDGALSDAAWDAAPVVSGFTRYNKPELVEPQTELMLVYDDTFLYFGVLCHEPNMDKVTPVHQPRDSGAIFHGETIEIFVDPNHDQSTYHQFGINIAASVYDSARSDPSWSADVRAATELSDDAWTLEVAIPWADMGVSAEPGMVVGVNVCRDRYAGGNKQWMNWSQTAANFHDPQRFGHVVLSPTPAIIGGLEAELRKGERRGLIAVYGPDRFVQASYRGLVASAVARAERLLDDLEAAGEREADPATKQELDRRIAEYRGELAGFGSAAAAEAALPPERWHEMTMRIGQLRGELHRILWEARLAALLSGI